MKLSINGIYNLGRAEKGAQKLYMSAEEILQAFRTGSYSKLANQQKAKLRKIANRLNKEYMGTQDGTSVPFSRYEGALGKQLKLESERFNVIYNQELIDNIRTADVMLYTMAKVGGSTIKQALQDQNKNVFQIHDLSVGMVKSLVNTTTMEHSFNLSMQELREAGKQRDKKLKIITGFRDPVMRDISLVFQYFYVFWYEEYASHRFANVSEAAHYFLENKLKPNMTQDWFNVELATFTGLNIFDYTFDKTKGYLIINGDWCDILLLRTDKITENQNTIAEFTECPNLLLKNTNQASAKWYRSHYQPFIESYDLATTQLETYYDNPTTRYFFTDEEITSMKKQWIKKEGV